MASAFAVAGSCGQAVNRAMKRTASIAPFRMNQAEIPGLRINNFEERLKVITKNSGALQALYSTLIEQAFAGENFALRLSNGMASAVTAGSCAACGPNSLEGKDHGLRRHKTLHGEARQLCVIQFFFSIIRTRGVLRILGMSDRLEKQHRDRL